MSVLPALAPNRYVDYLCVIQRIPVNDVHVRDEYAPRPPWVQQGPYSSEVEDFDSAEHERRSSSLLRLDNASGNADSTHDADALMSRAATGDQQAFASLYDSLAGLIYGLVLRIVRDPARSEEVTQEVFTELWRLAPTFDSERGNVRAFAVTIARRRAIDCVRSTEAARKRDDREALLVDQQVQSVEDAITDSGEASRVRQALAELPEPQRKAIEMAYFGSMSYREVAETLGAPVGTIKTRIRDGMKILRTQLGGFE